MPATGSLADDTFSELEVTNGFSLSSHSRFGYLKAVIAPFWGVDHSSFRVRLMGGYGTYPAWGGRAGTGLSEIMPGYALYRQRWGVTGYAGLVGDGHDTPDPLAQKTGTKVGVSVLIEPYVSITDNLLASGWVGWRSPYMSLETAVSLTYTATPRFQAKAEAVYFRDDHYEAFRVTGGVGYAVTPRTRLWAHLGVEAPQSGTDETSFAARFEIVTRPRGRPWRYWD
ncbi:MAG: cellulose biosynthesis protein BcsS [Pseudomonadota bacterium]